MIKREKIENILGGLTYFSMLVPMFCLSDNGHDCMYDECIKIWANDNFGLCIEKTINDLCIFLAGFCWPCTLIGGSLIISKNKNAISPFFFMMILIAVSVFAALLDPAKWRFVIASLFPAGLFITCAIFDSKNQTSLKRK